MNTEQFQGIKLVDFSFITEWIFRFAYFAEMHGVATALTLICLIQYVYQIYIKRNHAQRELFLISEAKSLEGEISELKQKRYLARTESSVLRDIFSNVEEGRTIELLLKSFVPRTTQGFALFYSGETNNLNIHATRGLGNNLPDHLKPDTDWLNNLHGNKIIRLAGTELISSQFVRDLDRKSRKKLSELFLIPVTDNKKQVGLIISSQLFPLGVEEEHQKSLVYRILECVTGSLKQTMTLLDQEQKLKLSQEKLTLRSIVDRNHETPSKLIDEYLSRMSNLLEASRGALALITPDANNPLKIISRQGNPLPLGTEAKWQEHEQRLAESAYHSELLTCLDLQDLENLEIDTLIGSALTVPLYQHDKMIGIICLTRRDQGIFTTLQIKLARWAADYLAETLLRVLDRVEIERNANMDGLTELANRRTFDLKIRQELARSKASGTTCSLCLLDLDHFKAVNDNYGHQAGDEVLKQFANILREESKKVRSTDAPLVARYGGEEMAVLLPGVGLDGAVRIAESIRLATNRMVVLHNHQRIHLTVSAGVSSFPRHADTAEALIEAADLALYQAKEEGRNCARFFNPPPAATSTNSIHDPIHSSVHH